MTSWKKKKVGLGLFKFFEFVDIGSIEDKEAFGHDEIPVVVVRVIQVGDDDPFLAGGMDHLALADIHAGVAYLRTAASFKKKQVPYPKPIKIQIG